MISDDGNYCEYEDRYENGDAFATRAEELFGDEAKEHESVASFFAYKAVGMWGFAQYISWDDPTVSGAELDATLMQRATASGIFYVACAVHTSLLFDDLVRLERGVKPGHVRSPGAGVAWKIPGAERYVTVEFLRRFIPASLDLTRRLAHDGKDPLATVAHGIALEQVADIARVIAHHAGLHHLELDFYSARVAVLEPWAIPQRYFSDPETMLELVQMWEAGDKPADKVERYESFITQAGFDYASWFDVRTPGALPPAVLGPHPSWSDPDGLLEPPRDRPRLSLRWAHGFVSAFRALHGSVLVRAAGLRRGGGQRGDRLHR